MASVAMPSGPAMHTGGGGPVATGGAPRFPRVRIKLRASLNGIAGAAAVAAPGAGGGAAGSSSSARAAAAKRKLHELLKACPEPEHASLQGLAAVLGLHGDAEPFTASFPQWADLLAGASKDGAHAQHQPAGKRLKAVAGPSTAGTVPRGQVPLPPPPMPPPPAASAAAAGARQAQGFSAQATVAAGTEAGAQQQRHVRDATATAGPGSAAAAGHSSDRKPAGVSSIQVPDSALGNSNGGAQLSGQTAPGAKPAPLAPPAPGKLQPGDGQKESGATADEAGGHSSNSTNTFAITFHCQNPSPTEVTGSNPTIVLRPPSMTESAVDAAAAGPGQQQAHQQQAPKRRAPQGRSIAVQTSDPASLLPAHLFPGLGASSSTQAAADAPSAVSLSQLTLPPHVWGLSLPSLDAPQRRWGPSSSKEVEGLLAAASKLKHEADRQRGPATAPWTLPLVAMYVDASLLYMRAIEVMMLPDTPDRGARAVSLCDSTCKFLIFTSRAAEAAIASPTSPPSPHPQLALARDCVKALCDRLAARCLMCDAFLNASRYKDFADRLDKLLLAQQQQQQQGNQHGRGGSNSGAAAGRGGGRGDPSPDDSHASSTHRPAQRQGGNGGGGGMQHVNVSSELGALQQRMQAGAQQAAKFADLVRRATLGFQALMDKEEARSNVHVVRAVAHMSGVGLGGPCDGALALACAEQALASLRHLW